MGDLNPVIAPILIILAIVAAAALWLIVKRQRARFLQSPPRRGNTVRVYDFETKRMSEIPAAELASGMLLANIEGLGSAYVKSAQLKPGDYQHPPFSDDVREFLRAIKRDLDEIYPKTLEEWEDGFRRDRNPAGEIALWLRLAETYQAFVNRIPRTAEEKEDLFRLLLAGISVDRKTIFDVYKPTYISAAEAEEAVQMLVGPKLG